MNFFAPTEIISNYARAGANKTKICWWKLLLSGTMAGLIIGFCGVATNTATHTIENVSVSRIITGLLFPFGLVMVILTGTELFTGNCLICISVLNNNTKLISMLRNWLLSYIGNFVGSIFLAAGCTFFGQLNYSSGGLAVLTIKLAAAKCTIPFIDALVMGFFCNVLVCLGVLCSQSAKDTTGKILGAYIPVSLFVISGFEHSIANMFYISAGLFALDVPEYALKAIQTGIDISSLTWRNFIISNLLPVTTGNILGGLSISILMWAIYLKHNLPKGTSSL
jgi:formate/nitrite transporter